MGVRIEGVATAHGGRVFGRGALHLSDAAARACLERAHRRPEELDLLINVGLYKNHNVAEPALASIIQEDLGANPGHPPTGGHHGTFSFDVLDGGCGVVTAARILAGFVGAGPAGLGLIVAADADPSPTTSRGFPFTPTGGALLLGRDDATPGFIGFEHRTFPAHAGMFEVHLRWEADAGLTHRGRNVVEVYEAPGFAGACAARGVEVAAGLLDRLRLRAADLDLMIASPYPPAFPIALGRGLGVAAVRVVEVAPALARAHTAGPIAGLEAAVASGRFGAARDTLIVTAGAGITIAAALYRSRPVG